MTFIWKWIGFLVVSIGIIFLSRASIRDPKSHGFYRFFSWEIILVLFLRNVDGCFFNPWGIRWKNRAKHSDELVATLNMDNIVLALSVFDLPKEWGSAQRELKKLLLDSFLLAKKDMNW